MIGSNFLFGSKKYLNKFCPNSDMCFLFVSVFCSPSIFFHRIQVSPAGAAGADLGRLKGGGGGMATEGPVQNQAAASGNSGQME